MATVTTKITVKEEYVVTAQAFNRISGKPTGVSRDEKIDILSNVIFSGASTILEIKAAYENWWNNLNPNSNEIVMVSSVQKS